MSDLGTRSRLGGGQKLGGGRHRRPAAGVFSSGRCRCSDVRSAARARGPTSKAAREGGQLRPGWRGGVAAARAAGGASYGQGWQATASAWATEALLSTMRAALAVPLVLAVHHAATVAVLPLALHLRLPLQQAAHEHPAPRAAKRVAPPPRAVQQPVLEGALLLEALRAAPPPLRS